MIINISRAKALMLCPHKAFNRYHRRVESSRSMNLVDGGAFHDGVAHGLATKDWAAAKVAANTRFEEDRKQVTTIPEESYIFDDHRDMVYALIDEYKKAFESENYQVIQPECEFDVKLPGTHHNCILLHWVDVRTNEEHWGYPTPEAIEARAVRSPHSVKDGNCPCYTSHRFVGKTDAVVSWMNNIWLLEHKTSSIRGDMFWNQWKLDIQPTGYIYGIWKSLGIRPSGFVLNAIYKPSEKQVEAWNKQRKYGAPKGIKDYIGYEREAFLRSDEDLERFERQIIAMCDEWEWRVLNGNFRMSNSSGACVQYNRVCDYFDACMAHDEEGSLDAMALRPDDYVDVKLTDLLPKEAHT